MPLSSLIREDRVSVWKRKRDVLIWTLKELSSLFLLQLEEASKGIALIPNSPCLWIMLSLWIPPLVASYLGCNHIPLHTPLIINSSYHIQTHPSTTPSLHLRHSQIKKTLPRAHQRRSDYASIFQQVSTVRY